MKQHQTEMGIAAKIVSTIFFGAMIYFSITFSVSIHESMELKHDKAFEIFGWVMIFVNTFIFTIPCIAGMMASMTGTLDEMMED